jgi:hypothetical protein
MTRLRSAYRLLVGSLLALSLTADPAPAEEYDFVMVFGSQTSPKELRYTHTWATFVRAVGQGPDLRTYNLQINTISWLPRSLEIHVWRPWPEPGVNLDLYQTLAAVYANRESVTMWGPFVVEKEIFERSVFVSGVLNSGQAQYRAISGPYLLTGDCIHAVAAVDPAFGRGHYPLIRIGKPASRFIARQVMIRSPFDQWAYDNSWLIPRLGLDRYPIEIIPPQRIPKQNCVLCRCPD